MNWDEYNKLFHKLELNLVAFKPLMECDKQVLKLVNAAIEVERERSHHKMTQSDIIRLVNQAIAEEREACAKVCEEGGKDESGRIHVQAWGCAKQIRARGLQDMTKEAEQNGEEL